MPMHLTSLAKTPKQFQSEILDLLRSFEQALAVKIRALKRQPNTTRSQMLEAQVEYATWRFARETVEGITFRDPATEPGLGPQPHITGEGDETNS